jgi:hypothetical protein
MTLKASPVDFIKINHRSHDSNQVQKCIAGAKQDLKSTHEYNLRHELLLVIHFGNGTNQLNHAYIPRLTMYGGMTYFRTIRHGHQQR